METLVLSKHQEGNQSAPQQRPACGYNTGDTKSTDLLTVTSTFEALLSTKTQL